MNKASSNFIAEMLVKTLGAELKGAPGTWPKGIDVTQELLGELGIPKGSYQLRNGSGLNDTNRFSAHQMITLLTAVWKRFPVAAEFVSSLGIAARDGTMRLRMEGTDAAGRLRAKTGTLDKVTALSGFVQSVGGERFAFSVLVNDWSGRSAPVVSSVDRLGGILASAGASEKELLAAAQAPVELSPAELRARVVTYSSMAHSPDKKNLAFLRSALRSERDPVVRIAAADALVRSDPEQGGGALLEAMPPSAELFAKLRVVSRELSLPIPAVSPLLDMAVDGSAEALARLLALAPLARGAQHDEPLEALLSKGLADVADASPAELVAALRAAPAVQAQAAVELAAIGLIAGESDPAGSELARALKEARGADAAQAQAWLAVLERRAEPPPAAAAAVAHGAASPEGPQKSAAQGSQPASATPPPSGAALPRPETPITATTLAPVAAAAAAALTPPTAAVNASFGAGDQDWPVTVIPNPAWESPRANAPTSSGPAAIPAGRAAPAAQPQQACTAEASRCSSPRDTRPGG
jgi:D-alanyl-D-alanine carboxypeptidase/D-alanyl-D-alanine-endopeptidase (penicillin-binding protein 4)